MEKATLNNGVEMPYVGLGVFRMEDNEDNQAAIEQALSSGYRHIDTAAYYKNEAAVGRAIKNSGVAREDIFITTKIWNDDQRSRRIMEAFETSLYNLDTDYVDLYLIHWPVPERFYDTWVVLGELYRQGRVKAIGVSNFQIHHLEALKEVSDLIPAVNQVELHPYLTQQPLLDYCRKEGIQLEAWSPFAASKTGLFEEALLLELADKYGKSPAQVVLRWNIQRGVVVIPKSVHKERLEENLDVFDFSLEERDVSRISSLNKNMRIGADPDHFSF